MKTRNLVPVEVGRCDKVESRRHVGPHDVTDHTNTLHQYTSSKHETARHAYQEPKTARRRVRQAQALRRHPRAGSANWTYLLEAQDYAQTARRTWKMIWKDRRGP